MLGRTTECIKKNSISANLSSLSVAKLVVNGNGGTTNTNGFLAFLLRVVVRFFPRHVMLEYFLNVDDIDA